MKIDVHIDLEIPRAVKRFAARVLPAAILLLGFGSTVDAAPPSFAAGEVLSAAKMNSHFGEIDGRLAKVETRLANLPVYVKPSLATAKGDLVGLGVPKGYGGARTACQTAVGKPTAHVCTAEEAVRSASSGITLPAGWITTGIGIFTDNGGLSTDCGGFTTQVVHGVSWTPSAYPYPTACTAELPLLCCDAP